MIRKRASILGAALHLFWCCFSYPLMCLRATNCLIPCFGLALIDKE